MIITKERSRVLDAAKMRFSTIREKSAYYVNQIYQKLCNFSVFNPEYKLEVQLLSCLRSLIYWLLKWT